MHFISQFTPKILSIACAQTFLHEKPEFMHINSFKCQFKSSAKVIFYNWLRCFYNWLCGVHIYILQTKMFVFTCTYFTYHLFFVALILHYCHVYIIDICTLLTCVCTIYMHAKFILTSLCSLHSWNLSHYFYSTRTIVFVVKRRLRS